MHVLPHIERPVTEEATQCVRHVRSTTASRQGRVDGGDVAMGVLQVVEEGRAHEDVEIPAGNERRQVVDRGDHRRQDLR